jgi:hypothetical protein
VPLRRSTGEPVIFIRSGQVHDRKIQRLSYVPGILRGQGPPDFARPAQVPEVVQRISDMSAPFGTRFEVGEEEVALALEPAT